MKISQITNEWILTLARRVKVQRIMEATKDNKEFDIMKRHGQKNNTFVREKSV